MKRRKRVALLISPGWFGTEVKVRGILDYAREHGNWTLVTIPENFSGTLRNLLRWQGATHLLDCGFRRLAFVGRRGADDVAKRLDVLFHVDLAEYGLETNRIVSFAGNYPETLFGWGPTRIPLSPKLSITPVDQFVRLCRRSQSRGANGDTGGIQRLRQFFDLVKRAIDEERHFEPLKHVKHLQRGQG